MTALVLRGDARALPLPDCSVDAIVCDPPYGLEFMGADWDSFRPASAQIRKRVDGRTNPAEGKSTTNTPNAYVAGRPFQDWCEQWAREALRVLKPGGHLVAFGGTRTWHRLVCGIEDAGFEIRDSMAWLYGQGFPKSLDVSKAIDAAAGAEREVVGLSPHSRDRTASSYQGDDGQHGYVGRSEGTRVVTAPATADAGIWAGWGTALKPGFEPIAVARKPIVGSVAANVLTYGTGALNIDACRLGYRDRTNYGLAGATRTKVTTYGEPSASADFDSSLGRWPTNVVLDGAAATELDAQTGVSTSRSYGQRSGAAGDGWRMSATGAEYDDQGGASRFFPVFRYEAKAPADERPSCIEKVMRLRSDISESDRAYVLSELRKAGVDVGE